MRTRNMNVTLITGLLGGPHFQAHLKTDSKNVVWLPANKMPYWYDLKWLSNHEVMVHIFGLYEHEEVLEAELRRLRTRCVVSQYDNGVAEVENITPDGQVVAAEESQPVHLTTYFIG